MKRASIREFRANLAELIEQDEPIIVTRHGRPTAVTYPLKNVHRVPPEVRHDLIEDMVSDLGLQHDEVIDVYKRDIDRSLIRENLRRAPEERIRALEALQKLHDELRSSSGRSR